MSNVFWCNFLVTKHSVTLNQYEINKRKVGFEAYKGIEGCKFKAYIDLGFSAQNGGVQKMFPNVNLQVRFRGI